MKVKELDRHGREIEEIWASYEENYTIYFIKGNYTRAEIDGRSDFLYMCHKITGLINEIDTLVPSNNKRYKFVREQIANAVQEVLNGQEDIAKEILLELKNKLINEREYIFKIYYLFGSIILITLNVFFSILIYTSFIKISVGLSNCIFALTVGSVGGLMSQAIRIKELDINVESSKTYNLIMGFYRIIFSMIGGMFIFFVIKSNLLLGDFSNNKYALYTFSLVGGVSESFIPDMIKKIEEKSKG